MYMYFLVVCNFYLHIMFNLWVIKALVNLKWTVSYTCSIPLFNIHTCIHNTVWFLCTQEYWKYMWPLTTWCDVMLVNYCYQNTCTHVHLYFHLHARGLLEFICINHNKATPFDDKLPTNCRKYMHSMTTCMRPQSTTLVIINPKETTRPFLWEWLFVHPYFPELKVHSCHYLIS